jgi:hypothetical protein
MRRRHDPFLKCLYRAGTRDALTLFLPDLAEKIDWDQWQWIDKEVPILGRRRPRSVVADLVGLTRDRAGRYVKVLVHPELQMEPDADMDWRALQYNIGLLLQEGNLATRVITVVFYHCAGTGGIQERRIDLDFYEKSLLRLTYWTVGLGDLDAEPYAERDNPMGWALASWVRQRPESRVELRLRLVEKILRFVRGDEYQELLLDAVQSYYRLSGRERRIEEQLLRSGRYRGMDELAQTVMERREARARRESAVETGQRSLIAVITARFPHVAEGVIARIERIQDPKTLDSLIRQAAVAPSLEEIERHLIP